MRSNFPVFRIFQPALRFYCSRSWFLQLIFIRRCAISCVRSIFDDVNVSFSFTFVSSYGLFIDVRRGRNRVRTVVFCCRRLAFRLLFFRIFYNVSCFLVHHITVYRLRLFLLRILGTLLGLVLVRKLRRVKWRRVYRVCWSNENLLNQI